MWGTIRLHRELRLYVNTFANFAVIDATINAILPQILTDSIGLVADLRYVGIGDIVKFKILPNQFFTVSKGNYRPAC